VIEDGAFSVCSSLKSICIPSSLERIKHDCFNRCSSLSRVTFEPSPRTRMVESSAIPAGVTVVGYP
jgi:hypothetical protein